MIKRAAVLILSIISLIGLIYCAYSFSVGNEKTDRYHVEIFKSNDGWGYQIMQDEKVVILQSHMPCVKGEQPFPDKKAAKEVGELVVLKIMNNEDPTVTTEELNERISKNTTE